MLNIFDMGMVCIVDLLCNHFIKLLSKLVHWENKKFEQNWNLFYLNLHVFLYERNVKYEMLLKSSLMVRRVLLTQNLGILRD